MLGESQAFLDGMRGAQTLGILNGVRTGDPRIDMVLAMCFPFLVRWFIEAGRHICHWLAQVLHRRTGAVKHERRIVCKQTRDQWGNLSFDDQDSQNTILIKAIELYLHSEVKLDLQRSDVALTSTGDKSTSLGHHNNHCHYNQSHDDRDKSVAGALAKYRVVHKPPINTWHDLGEYGHGMDVANVHLLVQQQELNGAEQGKSQQVFQTMLFQSDSGNAIDTFIQDAYHWYLTELRKLDDKSRYFYELMATKKEANADPSSQIYTRYKLSDEKTFESLFFREKSSLLKLVKSFQNRTGKYQIAGYPHKLGLLLSGAPGSGKTSFIKALAQHTGRCIVNVPLARISTNAELMSVFFDSKRTVQGENLPVKLGFEDVIFVMEDVDAASRIVHRRDGKSISHEKQIDTANVADRNLPTPKSPFQLFLESNNYECKQLVQKLIGQSPELKDVANQSTLLIQAIHQVQALPGLGLVGLSPSSNNGGDSSSNAMNQIGAEALSTANQILHDKSTIDRYLGTQARILLNQLEHGAVVDKAFVNTLLGKTQAAGSLNGTSSNQNEGPCLDLTAMLQSDPLLAHLMKGNSPSGVSTPTSAASGDTATSSTRASTTSVSSSSICSSPMAYVPPSPPHVSSSSSSSHWTSKPEKDQLNLSGFLNVLDGVVDSPGRMVIMTTNHVEHLDPALIRPGRIDKRLVLGHMHWRDCIHMLEHYFQQHLSQDQRDRVEGALNESTTVAVPVTPAQVEQMTAEFEELDDMIAALENRGQKKEKKHRATWRVRPY